MTMGDDTAFDVGVIGLGIMGSSYARHLIKAGYRVVGFDIASSNLEAFSKQGGTVAGSPRDVAASSSVILTALPSEQALDDIGTGAKGLPAAVQPGAVVCELSTLPIDAKERLRSALADCDAAMLDCPVSGTGAQAALGEIDIFASGDKQQVERLRPLFDAFSRRTYYVGPFGNGMKYKYIANHLVTIHNAAAAEALFLARRAGLDLAHVLEVVSTGAGTSRMFEVRGPLMVENRYMPATARVSVHLKDIALIEEFARSNDAPVDLFNASVPFYVRAMADGRQDEDTASIHAVIATGNRH